MFIRDHFGDITYRADNTYALPSSDRFLPACATPSTTRAVRALLASSLSKWAFNGTIAAIARITTCHLCAARACVCIPSSRCCVLDVSHLRSTCNAYIARAARLSRIFSRLVLPGRKEEQKEKLHLYLFRTTEQPKAFPLMPTTCSSATHSATFFCMCVALPSLHTWPSDICHTPTCNACLPPLPCY